MTRMVFHRGEYSWLNPDNFHRVRPASLGIDDVHIPDHQPTIPGEYATRARGEAETTATKLGRQCPNWPLEAAAVERTRRKVKVAENLALSKTSGTIATPWGAHDSGGSASWYSSPLVRRSSFISASKIWRFPPTRVSRASFSKDLNSL